MKKSEYLNIGVLYEQESILLEVLMKKTAFTIIHRYNFHAESSICGHIQYILCDNFWEGAVLNKPLSSWF